MKSTGKQMKRLGNNPQAGRIEPLCDLIMNEGKINPAKNENQRGLEHHHFVTFSEPPGESKNKG